MSKILYILTTGTESKSLRLGRRVFNNKEVVFSTPEEAIRFIEDEQPNLVVLDEAVDGDSILESINKINFSQPVKSINFVSKKVPVGIFSLLLHFN